MGHAVRQKRAQRVCLLYFEPIVNFVPSPVVGNLVLYQEVAGSSPGGGRVEPWELRQQFEGDQATSPFQPVSDGTAAEML